MYPAIPGGKDKKDLNRYVDKYFCKNCGWKGNKLKKTGCVTYADEWYICPKCKRDASEVIARNAALEAVKE